jgi:hypothetical protein
MFVRCSWHVREVFVGCSWGVRGGNVVFVWFCQGDREMFVKVRVVFEKCISLTYRIVDVNVPTGFRHHVKHWHKSDSRKYIFRVKTKNGTKKLVFSHACRRLPSFLVLHLLSLSPFCLLPCQIANSGAGATTVQKLKVSFPVKIAFNCYIWLVKKK